MAEEGSVPARVALFHGWAESPVWHRAPGSFGPVDLRSLPISAGLRERLLDWNAFADRTLSTHGCEWPDPETQAAFIATGSTLAEELRIELHIEVIYDTPRSPPQR